MSEDDVRTWFVYIISARLYAVWSRARFNINRSTFSNFIRIPPLVLCLTNTLPDIVVTTTLASKMCCTIAVMKVQLLLQLVSVYMFARRSIFLGGSSLATYLITSDDVYGARNQGFSEEPVSVSWRGFTVICAMLAAPWTLVVFRQKQRLFIRHSCWYKVALESRWWYYAAVAVSELNRWRQLRRGGLWSWIRAPSFCRCFPRRRESPPGWPGPPGPMMTASAVPKTPRWT